MSCGAGRTCEIQVGHPIQLFIEHLDTIAASCGLEKVRSVSGMLVHPQSEREVGLSSDSIRWSESTGILSFYIRLSEKPHIHTRTFIRVVTRSICQKLTVRRCGCPVWLWWCAWLEMTVAPASYQTNRAFYLFAGIATIWSISVAFISLPFTYYTSLMALFLLCPNRICCCRANDKICAKGADSKTPDDQRRKWKW